MSNAGSDEAQPKIKLALRNLGKTFVVPGGSKTALEGINAEVPTGEFVSIVGASGCGKSTLIRIIAGLEQATVGGVFVEDELVTKPGNDRGMVFQQFSLFPWLSVQANVMFGLQDQYPDKTERAGVALEWVRRVGLEEFSKYYPKQLSGGMQQRVAIARALAPGPKVLLMDEPFAALDAQTRSLMQRHLLEIWRNLNITVVFITHDLEEALRIGDQIAILRDGEVVQQGTPQQIVLKPKDDYIADFTKDINRGRVIQLKTIMNTPNDKPGPELSGEMLVEDAAQLVTESPSSQARVTDDAGLVVGVVGINDLIRAMARPDIESRLEEL